MYNNPKRIKKISDDIVEKIGWERLTDYNISEREINNLVRADIRPGDISEEKIIDDVVCQLDRMCFSRKRKLF